jgi:hypothetical protein
VKIERAQELAELVGRALSHGAGIRSHRTLPDAVHAGQAVDGLRCLRGALLVHAQEVADAIDAVDDELCKLAPPLEREPLQVIGARVLAADERRRRRQAARP